MSKESSIINILNDLGIRRETELTDAQQEQIDLVLNPELKFLKDVEDLFTPDPE